MYSYTLSPATHMLQGEPWCFHRSEVGFCTSETGCGKYKISVHKPLLPLNNHNYEMPMAYLIP